MNSVLERSIAALEAERDRLNEAIESLRKLQFETRPVFPKGQRGRKSMGIEERKQVSLRMQEYWKARKASA